jgi:hypothetical protein
MDERIEEWARRVTREFVQLTPDKQIECLAELGIICDGLIVFDETDEEREQRRDQYVRLMADCLETVPDVDAYTEAAERLQEAIEADPAAMRELHRRFAKAFPGVLHLLGVSEPS